MHPLRPLLLAAALAAAQLSAPRVLAQQSPSPLSISAAEALFEEGRSALAASDLDTACARFRESNRLDPAVGTLLNLADCEERRGKLATAWTLFRSAKSQLAASDDRLAITQQRLTELEPRVPKLVLSLAPGAPPETRARVAGAELGSASFGVPLPLDPGDYELVVSAPGRGDRVLSLNLSPGQTEQLAIVPGPALATAPPPERPPAPKPAEQSSNRTLMYVAGGIGIAGLSVGAVAGLLTLRQKDIADANCNDERKVCDAAGDAANRTGRTLAAVSTVGFVLGVLGAGGATYLYLTAPDEPKSTAIGAEIGENSAVLSFGQRF